MQKRCKHSPCKNEPAPGRNECYKCRSRLIAERKPIDVCYYYLKKSAKKRSLPFTIKLVWFKKWIIKTGYMEGKGRLGDNLNIDRKDNLLGYVMGNLQVITKTANVSKFHAEDLRRELGPQYEGEAPF